MSDELITETGIPHWLQPPKLDDGEYYTEWVWETLLERLSEGQTIKAICSQPNMPSESKLRKWIFADPARKARYYEAQELGADKIEDEILDIVDQCDEDKDAVALANLRVNTRKWLVMVKNRHRYGEKTQLDVNHSIDISEAMAMAEKRVLRGPRVIEGELDD